MSAFFLFIFNSRINCNMTTELEKVIQNLNQLSKEEQTAIAALIQDELLWDLSIKTSSKKLSSLAEEAVTEYQKGKTKKGDW